MHDELERAFGPQHWWPAETPFEVILGAYLTQNTSWKAVEVSLANLRDAGALTVEGLRALSVEQLQELIRPSGFYTPQSAGNQGIYRNARCGIRRISLINWLKRRLPIYGIGSLLCPASVLRLPMRFCSTRSTIRFR